MEEISTRTFHPLAITGSLFAIWNFPIGRESAEMVKS